MYLGSSEEAHVATHHDNRCPGRGASKATGTPVLAHLSCNACLQGLSEVTGDGAPTLHTAMGSASLCNLLHPQALLLPGRGPSSQLAPRLAAGPCLFGETFRAAPLRLFMALTLLHEPPRAVLWVPSSAQLGLLLYLSLQ